MEAPVDSSNQPKKKVEPTIMTGRSLGTRRGVWAAILPAIVILAEAAVGQPGGAPVFSVRTAPAEKVSLAPTLSFTGSIEPWRIIDIPSQVAGRVESIPIEEGQTLRSGDLICRLDPEELTILVARQEALLKGAIAEHQRLSSGLLPEEIEEAEKNVDAAEARFGRARDDWERFRPLVDQGVSTLTQGAQMEAAYHEAQAQLRSAEARLRLLRRGFREEAVLKAKAEVDKEKADLAEIHRRLTHHRITAPTDCVVIERLSEPAEWVDMGTTLARVAVLNPLRVRLDVPQMHLTKLRIGQTASLRVDGWDGKTYDAVVERIVPSSGVGTRNFPVLMRLENPDLHLSAGLFARVELRLENEREMTVVPRQAVLVRGEQQVVLVADPIRPAAEMGGQSDSGADSENLTGPTPDASIRLVVVRTGNDVGGHVVVDALEGPNIEPGEEVVVLGGTRLQPGMPVRIIRDETEPQTLDPQPPEGSPSE